MIYTFHVTPMGAVRQTRSDAWKDRPAVLAYRAFRDALRFQSNLKKYTVSDRLYITFYLPIPKSWSKKKQFDMVGKPHQQKPDTDNLVKAFQDALAIEDGYIWEVVARKYWDTGGRIEVVVP